MKPNKEAIKQHLEFLFKDTPTQYSDGRIEIAYTGVNTGALNAATYFGLDELEKAAEFACEKNSKEGCNIYVGAALRSPDCPPFGRSSLENYYSSTVAWADIDDATAAQNAKEKYKDLPPHLIVVTGRHPDKRFQAWWKLENNEDSPDELKGCLSGLRHAVDGDPAVVDAARVMRVGGSVAWPKKKGRVPELTEVAIPSGASGKATISNITQVYPPTDYAPSNDSTQAKDIFTGTFDIEKLLEATREEGSWYVNMRNAVASMIGKRWTDEQIRIATRPYLRDRSLIDDMITPLISSARRKYDKPSPVEEPVEYDEETGEIKKKRSLFYINAPDVQFKPDTKDFVQGLLTEGALSVVYGESNCGKTFFMSDLAFHIVQGLTWNDRRVEEGKVLYVAMEGSYGLTGRIEAYKKEVGTNLDGFLMMPCSVDFTNPEGNINEFIEVLEEVKEKEGDLKLIVIDTLARAMGGADENSGQDMGMLVKHADIIRQYTNAHVSFVHHSGKDKAKGSRGHSSLRAAVDTEVEVSREEGADFSNIKVAKQRDMEKDDDWQFKLQQVVLGVNKHGEEITSCIVVPTEVSTQERVVKMNDMQNLTYNSLIDALDRFGAVRQVNKDVRVTCITYDELRIVMEEGGYKELLATKNKTTAQQIKSATQTARNYLIRHNKMGCSDGYLWKYKTND